MRIIYLFSFLLSLSFLASSCKDCLETTLPEVSTTGQGTFGCLWDGEPWRNYQVTNETVNEKIIHRDSDVDRFINIYGTRKFSDECGGADQLLYITFWYNTQDSIIDVYARANDWNKTNPKGNGGYKYYMIEGEPFEFETLRLDRAERIFSATFSGRLKDTLANEILMIESGRVDMKF